MGRSPEGLLGVGASLAAGLVTLGSVVFLLVAGIETWTTLDDYVATYTDVRMVHFALWFTLPPLVVVAFAIVHRSTAPEAQAFSLLALVFAVLYAALSCLNYGLQLTFVRQHILAGDTAGLEPWVASNPGSAMFFADIFGYFFLGVATLFAAPLHRGRVLGHAIRGLFLVNGIMGVGGLIGVSVVSPAGGQAQIAGVLGIIAWGFVFGPAILLLAWGFLHGFPDASRVHRPPDAAAP